MNIVEHANDFCDVLVVGSGPAGIAAAQELANKNLYVILIEQDSLLGGNNLSKKDFDAAHLLSHLKSSGVRVMSRTTAFGIYDNTVVGALERVTDHLPNPDVRLPLVQVKEETKKKISDALKVAKIL